MFTQFERLVAARYLRARKGERFVSIIAIFSLVGIALGVATLIVVASVMTGFQTEIVSRVLAANGHIVLQAYAGEKIQNYQKLTADIAALPGVIAATPVLDGQELAAERVPAPPGGAPRASRVVGVRRQKPQARVVRGFEGACGGG